MPLPPASAPDVPAMARLVLLLSLSLGLLASLLPALAACPQNCHCHSDLQHVICDKVGLQKIPKVSEIQAVAMANSRCSSLVWGGWGAKVRLQSSTPLLGTFPREATHPQPSPSWC